MKKEEIIAKRKDILERLYGKACHAAYRPHCLNDDIAGSLKELEDLDQVTKPQFDQIIKSQFCTCEKPRASRCICKVCNNTCMVCTKPIKSQCTCKEPERMTEANYMEFCRKCGGIIKKFCTCEKPRPAFGGQYGDTCKCGLHIKPQVPGTRINDAFNKPPLGPKDPGTCDHTVALSHPRFGKHKFIYASDMKKDNRWRGTVCWYCRSCGKRLWEWVEKKNKFLGKYKTKEYIGDKIINNG